MKLADSILGRTEEKKVDEAVDVKKVIKDLIDTEASDDNADQGKFVQLLKGLAFSDEKLSDQFMKKLTAMVSDKNFGSLTESKKNEALPGELGGMLDDALMDAMGSLWEEMEPLLQGAFDKKKADKGYMKFEKLFKEFKKKLLSEMDKL